MPELPDIELYLDALRERVLSQPLLRVRLASPFLLRSVDPPLALFENKTVLALQRLGKRIVFTFEDDLHLVLHLMIAGRLRWQAAGSKLPGKLALAAFDFAAGALVLTEASKRKRASLHAVRGATALSAHDPGGIDPFDADLDAFTAVLRSRPHTLKRALTDPRLLSGVGNAYSDEILHAAQISPFKRTDKLSADELERLWNATRQTLASWLARLRAERGTAFPHKVTAFREEMAVHGRFGSPCPRCGDPIQRIVYAANEANYCATCQTGGKLLADRARSRLLKKDWPRTLEDLEARLARDRQD